MPQARRIWLALLLFAASAAAAGPRERDAQELLAADRARTEAMVSGDYAALERALGEDLTYGHSGGQVQDKRQFIDDLRQGVRRYRALTGIGPTARSYGCAGVVTGTANVEVEYQGRLLSLVLRYTATYARQHGRWVLVAYQSVRLPDAADAPAPTVR